MGCCQGKKASSDNHDQNGQKPNATNEFKARSTKELKLEGVDININPDTTFEESKIMSQKKNIDQQNKVRGKTLSMDYASTQLNDKNKNQQQ